MCSHATVTDSDLLSLIGTYDWDLYFYLLGRSTHQNLMSCSRILNSIKGFKLNQLQWSNITLDLGPISLLGAQQHITVESALKRQDKIEGKFKAHIQSDNGQYGNEMYKRAENMIPQLDGTFNVSDSSDTDSHDYLDLASANIISHRTRGQKQRHEENEMTYTNRHSAHIEYIKPNTKVKTQRQKVPDDEDIDIAKLVKDDKPRHDRQRALETERQLQEKEAKRLALAKVK